MTKDTKKALYESIMTSVAKEVKKVLNESEDKQARLDQLTQEYDEISSKIDDMEEDFFKKMFGVNKNSKEYFDALDDYYKSIKPLEDEMHNKISEIIKLKKEIAVASKQTINQSGFSKKTNYSYDNNYVDYGYNYDTNIQQNNYYNNDQNNYSFKWNEHIKFKNTKHLIAAQGGNKILKLLDVDYNHGGPYIFNFIVDNNFNKKHPKLPSNDAVLKDLSIQNCGIDWNAEDGGIEKIGTTSNGIDYIVAWLNDCGGPAFYVILYWDGKNIRAYLPYKGNCIDTIDKCTFDGEHDNNDYIIKYLFPQTSEYKNNPNMDDEDIIELIGEQLDNAISGDLDTCIKDFEYQLGEYDEDKEYNNDDEEIKEKLSNIILNPDFKVKAGGRFAPIGGKTKLDLLNEDDLYEMFEDDPKFEQVRKDIKYDVDFENVSLDHKGTTKSGIDYLALLINGDWEEPVALFVYWDGKKYRGYIPTRGNAINTINKSAFGNDEDADNEYCTKYLGLKDYYGCDGCKFGLPINWDACLEEFETRLVVK